MNISFDWLKEYVDIEDMTPQELDDLLTFSGLEVDSMEKVETIKGGLEHVVIAQVLTCEPHPDSDHLHVTTVDPGQGEPLTVVCGAPNVAAGQKVLFAQLGTRLRKASCAAPSARACSALPTSCSSAPTTPASWCCPTTPPWECPPKSTST